MKKLLILFCFVTSLCACGNQTSANVEESDSIMVVDTINSDSILIVE